MKRKWVTPFSQEVYRLCSWYTKSLVM